MMLDQITSRCWMMRHDSSTDRPCLGYVQGDRYNLLIDAGNSPAHTQLMLDSLEEEGLPAPSFCVITHAHWDHTFGLCAVPAPVIACSATQERLNMMSRWKWTPEAMKYRLLCGEELPFCHENIIKEYADPCDIKVRTADIVFNTTMKLNLGGCTAVFTRQENSHEPDCIMVSIPEDKVIYLGDITYEDLHHVPSCIHRRHFENLRKALEDLDFTIAIAGHQPLMTRRELFASMEETLHDPDLLFFS